KKTVLSLLALSAFGISQAQYVVVITENYVIANAENSGETEQPPKNCVGEELSRSELIALIDSGQDYSQACINTITNLSGVFSGKSVDYDITGWDTAHVQYFGGMFSDSTSFNQDISGWDVSSGIDFSFMFKGATSFDQPIGNWNVGNSSTFKAMFHGATAFNQDINSWDVS
ncbi:DUF285 domain-containing protein, partial [Vibrio parahaemolyticus]|nr:DUF285 domain-containing protein [Vibrio parahaemolyticus]